MESIEHRPVYSAGDDDPTYLDIQSLVGITKHMGGYEATDELHRLCHLDKAHEVLEVGCGIGVGPAYIAKRFNCQVTAVDISEKMLSWARQRARREGIADRITFHKADICDLPFDDNRFDAVIVESVLAFVECKEDAIEECIRVIKPGGYLGINESYWIQSPPAAYLDYTRSIGSAIITEAEWRAIWEATPLDEPTIQPHPLQARQEFRDRINWVGWRSILPAWGRVLKILLTDARSRQAIKEQFNMPSESFKLLEYALFVGRKPRQPAT